MNSEDNRRPDHEVLVRVEGVSKKFCRSLKKSLWYGVCDIAGELNPFAKHGAGDVGRGGWRSEAGGQTTEVGGQPLDVLQKVHVASEGGGMTVKGEGLGVTGEGSEVRGQISESGRLRAEGLREGEFWAVNDVSFELRRGECLGLIGHNGAGKTTLLKMLNGLIKPDSGKITMRGRVGALIALGAGFNPILTGRENIYINGSVLGLSKKEIDEKIDEIIDFAEIGEFIDMPVQNYSSGMSVRLGFSIASSLSPDVLILDEVLAVGDIGFVIKCLNRVKELSSNAAVILVSHSMQSISSFCSRVIVMDRGRAELDTCQTGLAIDRYYALVGEQTNVAGSGGVALESVTIRTPGDEPFTQRELFSHGVEAFIDLSFDVRIQHEPVNILVAIDDASATQVICFPLVGDNGVDLEFTSGKHRVSFALGKLEFNGGKYSLLVSAIGAKSRVGHLRSAGSSGFRVKSDKNLWTKLIRPVRPMPA